MQHFPGNHRAAAKASATSTLDAAGGGGGGDGGGGGGGDGGQGVVVVRGRFELVGTAVLPTSWSDSQQFHIWRLR